MKKSQKHVKSIPLTQERTHTGIEGETMQCPKEKGTKEQTMINKTLHRKQQIEQHGN